MLKNYFKFSAGIIFLISGFGKIFSAFGNSELLKRNDPIFTVQFSHLMLIAGSLELLVASICFCNKSKIFGYLVTAWLATGITIYRIGLWWIGWRRPCHCLGNLTDTLHISPQIADTAMKIILAYLLIGSYATLFWLWRQKSKNLAG